MHATGAEEDAATMAAVLARATGAELALSDARHWLELALSDARSSIGSRCWGVLICASGETECV